MSFPKYGYVFADETKERYTPDPETAPVVQRLFVLYASGMSLRALGTQLTEEGIPTPAMYMAQHYGFKNRGKPVASGWRIGTLYRMLTDTGYIGKLIGNEYSYTHTVRFHPITRQPMDRVEKTLRTPDDPLRFAYGEDVCPALVSIDLWNRAQELLAVNKERASRNIIKPHNLVLRNGLGRCGYCGRALAVSWSKQTNNHRYACAARAKNDNSCPAPAKYSMSADTLDTAAWEWFMHKLDDKARMLCSMSGIVQTPTSSRRRG